MEKRNEKKVVVCALCIGLACSSNLGMLNIHAVETKAPETVAKKGDETQGTWVELNEFSTVMQNAIKRGYSNNIKDGKVNVEKIFTLTIEDETITSLDDNLNGIEKLSQLKQLYIFCKNLSGEVTLPKIDGLGTLEISNNKITKLNVGNLPNLINLMINGDKLESINLDNNKKLSYLNASYNNLISLDLSSNPEIATLDVQHNQLEEINLNSNTKLDTLHAHYNNLKSLDLSKCVNLTYLDVKNNPLTVLDISENTKLITVYASHVNPADDKEKGSLKEIKLGSEYPDLRYFYFQNNNVESFDFNKLTSKETITINAENNKFYYADLSGLESRKPNINLANNNLLGYDLGENWKGTIEFDIQSSADVETNGKGEVKLSDYGLTSKDFKNVDSVASCDYDNKTGIFSNIRGNIITYDFENAGKSMNVTLKVTHEFNENYWVKEPTIAAYNLLEEPQPKAEAKYGKVEFKYSKDNETFDSKKPNSAGTWYMKAYVEAGESYGGLESESKKFEVKKANGSATVEIEGWSEGEKPNSPVIKTEVYKPEEIHVSYKNNDTGEISSLPPTVAGSYSVIVDFYENDIYRGFVFKKNFMVEKEKQKEEELIKMIINLGDSSYFKLSDVNIDSLTSENEKEIKESLKGATYENGKFINISGKVVTFHYTLGNTICNYNLEIVRNSNQPVIVTMDIKAETDKDGNIYLKDLNLKNYKDEYASSIKSSCAGARFDNGKFYGFVNDKFIFAYNVNDKLTYRYRVTITKDNTVLAPDAKPEEPTNPVKPTQPAETKPADTEKPKDVVKDTSETTQDHTAGLLMGMVTLAGAIIVTNKKHEKE